MVLPRLPDSYGAISVKMVVYAGLQKYDPIDGRALCPVVADVPVRQGRGRGLRQWID